MGEGGGREDRDAHTYTTLARSDDTNSFHDSAFPFCNRPPLDPGLDPPSPGVVAPLDGGARDPLPCPPVLLVAGSVVGAGVGASSSPSAEAAREEPPPRRLAICRSLVSS